MKEELNQKIAGLMKGALYEIDRRIGELEVKAEKAEKADVEGEGNWSAVYRGRQLGLLTGRKLIEDLRFSVMLELFSQKEATPEQPRSPPSDAPG